ncbi:MAG: hypothetical protein K0R28_2007 [Paenibacillus sp.]|jgi:phage-related protein|nr:hypothetical protein [Paenibacillus sp.]
MNPKQIIIVSTMALVISFGAMMQSDKTYANAVFRPLDKSTKISVQDDFHQALGVGSDEQVHDALYSGQSLADIAKENNKDVQHVIDLQIAQLTEQLDHRLVSGAITVHQYESHKAELRDMITASAYGK